MNILIQYPSRGRPQQFKDGLRSIYLMATCVQDIFLQVVLDKDDPFLNDYFTIINEAADHWLYSRLNLYVNEGYSKSKIDAINRSLPLIAWDVLVVFSDDMLFHIFGWDHHIREAFNGNFDQFIHFREKDSADRVAVMHIVGRKYYEEDGYIYHPSYKSLFCDEEQTLIARMRGKYKFIDTEIFVHNNPAITGIGHKDDMLIEQQRIGWDEDRENFERRKLNNFFL